MIKLDMSKAYDRVSWRFPLKVLRAFGFSHKWCDLIFRNISNIWYSTLWQGKPFGFFKSNRGVREGDPLSPSLFILTIEVLTRMINKAMQQRPYHTVRGGSKSYSSPRSSVRG
ncbi:unnamed protein product [Rhodiola kirilowii]